MRGREFLSVASNLLADTSHEAGLRTSIGRAYYAAYLEARTLCEAKSGVTFARSAREHGLVAEMTKSILPESAVRLRFLRQFRNQADYDLTGDVETIRASAMTAYDEATKVIAEVDAVTDRMSEGQEIMESQRDR